MGWGDYIMTSGVVRRLKTLEPNTQIIINEPYNNTIFYKNIFYQNPYITNICDLDLSRPYKKIDRLLTGDIDTINNRIKWYKERVAESGNFYPTAEEVSNGKEVFNKIYSNWKLINKKNPKGVIFISNNLKLEVNINGKIIKNNRVLNKDWGTNNWSRLIKICAPDYIMINTSSDKNNNKELEGLYSVICDFRTTYSIMSHCDYFLGSEGGLHHLWATNKKQGAVIFGHWIPPYLTGYPYHINISPNDVSHCGRLDECEECINYLRDLSVDYIKSLVDKNFK
jgi:ADP-heptose:LPS heptosyltransferase